jgi:transcriptional regulator GlxA family with amidase domain
VPSAPGRRADPDDPVRIAILVFEQVDLLDVGGPYEVFLTASRLQVRDGGEPSFEVMTVGLTRDPVTAYGGLRLTPHHAIDEAGAVDLLVLPGAISIDDVLADEALMTAVDVGAQRAQTVASVCTGAFLLGRLGLLEGRRWTTHWEDVPDLAALISGTGEAWVRWVDEGHVVTAGGLSSGIAMALHLVDRFAGRELAVRTARQIEYDWDPESR